MLRRFVGPVVLTCTAAFAQTAAAPSFDVVSVKMVNSAPGDRPATHSDAGRIDYHLVPMKTLVRRAWQVEDYQVVWPAWMGNSNPPYDVSATMTPGTTADQLHLMLRDLLAKRFKLAAHRETRDTKVYALEVSPRGLRLRQAANPPVNEEYARYSIDVSRGRAWKIGSRNIREPEAPSGLSISGLLSVLPKFDHPLVDATGLKGYYDLELNIPLDPVPEVPVTDRGGDTSSITPSESQLIDALEKQLGLRVEAKTLPIEMLVIDHLERIPTEN